jgi:hypothetical protein
MWIDMLSFKTSRCKGLRRQCSFLKTPEAHKNSRKEKKKGLHFFSFLKKKCLEGG